IGLASLKLLFPVAHLRLLRRWAADISAPYFRTSSSVRPRNPAASASDIPLASTFDKKNWSAFDQASPEYWRVTTSMTSTPATACVRLIRILQATLEREVKFLQCARQIVALVCV